MLLPNHLTLEQRTCTETPGLAFPESFCKRHCTCKNTANALHPNELPRNNQPGCVKFLSTRIHTCLAHTPCWLCSSGDSESASPNTLEVNKTRYYYAQTNVNMLPTRESNAERRKTQQRYVVVVRRVLFCTCLGVAAGVGASAFLSLSLMDTVLCCT